jgi:hypothetical protein
MTATATIICRKVNRNRPIRIALLPNVYARFNTLPGVVIPARLATR